VLAGADDGIEHRRVVAGIRMSDKQPVFQTEFGGSDLAFGGVIVDDDVAVTRLGEEREFVPAWEAIGDGLAEDALSEDGEVARSGAQPGVELSAAAQSE
jgi:hypothetical protein